MQILLADTVEPGSLFDEINGLATPDGSLIVTFVPSGINSFGVNVHISQTRGDMNGDGDVDAEDATMFAWAIRDADSYYDRFILGGGGGDDSTADMDFDGDLTFADIPLFLTAVDQRGRSGGSGNFGDYQRAQFARSS